MSPLKKWNVSCIHNNSVFMSTQHQSVPSHLQFTFSIIFYPILCTYVHTVISYIKHFVTTETQSGPFIHNQRTKTSEKPLSFTPYIKRNQEKLSKKCYFSSFHPLKFFFDARIKKTYKQQQRYIDSCNRFTLYLVYLIPFAYK